MNQRTWTISELAKEFEVTPRTLRFYENHQILSPIREGQRRIYTHRDRTRLKLALRGKRLGFHLSEIRSLIDMYDGPGGTTSQLRNYLDALQKHKKQLVQQKEDLEKTLVEIEYQEKQCLMLLQELPQEKTK
ncbi:MerR family transcriptional regulator [Pelistega europaea]|uniref:MerR family DNA-binding transcriptional regulator n=1 Tax=Pelistega europaea TaxID=106147 RepID=A0A7Y4L7Y2_9BURK|nr:MerR family DNA-binding transcriptional regulator [Pelistega europaea]NOL48609.1 MerR family DNA-binding transcriptional regulator [Pelistega europaea]